MCCAKYFLHALTLLFLRYCHDGRGTGGDSRGEGALMRSGRRWGWGSEVIKEEEEINYDNENDETIRYGTDDAAIWGGWDTEEVRTMAATTDKAAKRS